MALFERQAGQVRLVLLDTDMPVLDGAATIPFLRALAPTVPIVLMSGQVASVAGSDGLPKLIKPFNLEGLLQTITTHLGTIDSPKPG